MYFRWRVLFWPLVLISLINISFGATNHTYPESGGLSGSDHHGYPTSGGLSGDNRGYPSSGGNKKYHTSGGTHGYISTGGRYNSSVGSNRHPTTVRSSIGKHPAGGRYNSSRSGYNSTAGRYNSSTGIHNFTSGGKYEYSTSRSNKVYSSPKSKHGYLGVKTTVKVHTPLPKKYVHITYTTKAHNVYRYTPPKTIKYIPPGGGPPVLYPVYQNPPPGYVYEIKDSGSIYGTLITGLALMNLGALADKVYDHGPNKSNYKIKPGEICLFGVKKANGDYKEFRIDCTFMTTFVINHEVLAPNAVTITTTTNVTVSNTTKGAPGTIPLSLPAPGNVLYAMLPNGTLVPVNITSGNPATNLSTTMTSSVKTIITNTTRTNALDVKGDPIAVTAGMKCYVIRVTGNLRTKKSLSCSLLQAYADRSIQKNSAIRNGPALTILIVLFSIYFIY